jgi:hypothetical protein
MVAWEIARKWQTKNCIVSFEELLGLYLSTGLVHSTPSVFLLAQEVTWDPIKKKIVQGNSNAWFVELAASACHAKAVQEFLRIVPFSHPWVLWCRQSNGRKHDIHAYAWHKLAKRVGFKPA